MIKLLGSWDGVNYTFISNQLPITSGAGVSDTLQWKGATVFRSGGSIVVNIAYTNGVPIPYPFLQIRYYNFGSGNNETPTLEWFGRQY